MSLPPVYQPKKRENKSLDSHNPKKNERTKITTLIIRTVLGDTERAIRSADEARPDATEPNVLVWLPDRLAMKEVEQEVKRTVSSRTRF
jgi:hypothetical protein